MKEVLEHMPATKQAKGKGRKIGTNKKKCDRYYQRNRLEINKKRETEKRKRKIKARKIRREKKGEKI